MWRHSSARRGCSMHCFMLPLSRHQAAAFSDSCALPAVPSHLCTWIGAEAKHFGGVRLHSFEQDLVHLRCEPERKRKPIDRNGADASWLHSFEQDLIHL